MKADTELYPLTEFFENSENPTEGSNPAVLPLKMDSNEPENVVF